MSVKFALVGFMILTLCSSSVRQVSGAEVAPDFTLTDIDGNGFSIADFKGRVVILTFVATRFLFCETQANIIMAVSDRFQGDLILLAVGVSAETHPLGGDTDAQLQEFKSDTQFSGTVARDTDGVAADYNVTYVPTTFIIDQDGYISHRHVGVVQKEDLVKELQLIIPEFPSGQILLIFIISAAIAVAVIDRRKQGFLRVRSK
jgi:peroxiredoxin